MHWLGATHTSRDWKMLACWCSSFSVRRKARDTWWFSSTDLAGRESRREIPLHKHTHSLTHTLNLRHTCHCRAVLGLLCCCKGRDW